VESTIAAVRAADGLFDKIYLSTTLLGMGERSGNAETEKAMMNLYAHYGVKKFEDGLFWAPILSDKAIPYIELQSGRFRTQSIVNS
jgi:hypothetical protein